VTGSPSEGWGLKLKVTMNTKTQIKERPIIFSGEMVRAILDGRKTQTRRVVKKIPCGCGEWLPDEMCVNTPEGWQGIGHSGKWWCECCSNDDLAIKCPYGVPGNRLVVAKSIPGVMKTYCAGSDGKIYSKARGDWKPLKSFIGSKGYPQVTIMVCGRPKATRNIHSLVCAAFYGCKPDPSMECRHLDGIKENCLPSNLAWGTRYENWADRKAHGNGIEGEKHHSSKFTNIDREHIRWAWKYGVSSQRHMANTLGVSQAAINEICKPNNTGEFIPQDPPLDRIPIITLEVVNVRVERLQDISCADCFKEGILKTANEFTIDCDTPDPRDEFKELWNSINGPYAWEKNPWVWVVEFKAVKLWNS